MGVGEIDDAEDGESQEMSDLLDRMSASSEHVGRAAPLSGLDADVLEHEAASWALSGPGLSWRTETVEDIDETDEELWH